MTDAWVPSGNDLKPSGLSIHTHVDAVDDAVEVGHLEGARTAAGERGEEQRLSVVTPGDALYLRRSIKACRSPSSRSRL